MDMNEFYQKTWVQGDSFILDFGGHRTGYFKYVKTWMSGGRVKGEGGRRGWERERMEVRREGRGKEKMRGGERREIMILSSSFNYVCSVSTSTEWGHPSMPQHTFS